MFIIICIHPTLGRGSISKVAPQSKVAPFHVDEWAARARQGGRHGLSAEEKEAAEEAGCGATSICCFRLKYDSSTPETYY
jgi:hypothetical protein